MEGEWKEYSFIIIVTSHCWVPGTHLNSCIDSFDLYIISVEGLPLGLSPDPVTLGKSLQLLVPASLSLRRKRKILALPMS